MSRLWSGVVAAVLLAACAVLSSQGCSEPSQQSSLPEGLEGHFHLTGEVGDLNPTTLRLDADGTFAWGVSGCDYFGGDVGTWTREDDGIVLHPAEGHERFLWSKQHVVGPVERVVIVASKSGLEATPPSEPAQQWEPGGVCPVCSTFESVACDDPYLADKPSISRADE